jgi:uncharacterized protein with PQ loop repeat
VKESIGWAASIIILITTIGQIRKQWKAGTSKGVSMWLFIGNIVAAGLFATYAVLIHNLIYIVTNLLMLVASVVGLLILLHHRRRDKKQEAPAEGGG